MNIEAMKKAAAAFDKIIDGCNGIEEEDTHPEAKKVARLVRKDCLRALEALRQAIAEAEKQEPVAIGEEWKPCVKLPIVVHVREQRKGETHVSTREGITPVKEDDLIMRGVAGEEYPIGRELFNRTYTFDTAPVHASDMSQERVDETAKRKHEWEELDVNEVIELIHEHITNLTPELTGELYGLVAAIDMRLQEKNHG